jgi:hypothetical protein
MRIQYRHLLGAKRRNLVRLARFLGLRGVSRLRKAAIAEAVHVTVNP